MTGLGRRVAKRALKVSGVLIAMAAFTAAWLFLHMLVGSEWPAARPFFDVVFGALVGACVIELWLGAFRR